MDLPLIPISGCLCACISLATLYYHFFKGGKEPSKLVYPPGPPRLPFLGNALAINFKEPHLTYTQWGKNYGDVVFSKVLGHAVIIVNSEEAARELSDEKRSAIYSDRPSLSAYNLFSIDHLTVSLPYGPRLRSHKRLLHKSMRVEAIEEHRGAFICRASSVVLQLLREYQPCNLDHIMTTYAASSALAFFYGYEEPSGENDPSVAAGHKFAKAVINNVPQEKAMFLERFPFLKYVTISPAYYSKLSQEAKDIPFKYVSDNLKDGKVIKSMVAEAIQQGESSPQAILDGIGDVAKDSAATVYLASMENNSSALLIFFLAMVLFPDAQQKAQDEIDTVIGLDRLPTFADRKSLPYVSALVYEILRWHPSIPLGVPHALAADDVYKGYHMPKGAILLFNTWAMSRNFPNPDEFKPERHLSPTGELLPHAHLTTGSAFGVFGFGRRMCPARTFVDQWLWSSVIVVLTSIRLTKARDSQGREIEVKPEFTKGGAGTRPMPFQFAVVSRDGERKCFTK